MVFFRSKRPIVTRTKFPIVIEKIGLELESNREEFVFGLHSGLKSEGAAVNGIPRILEAGSELDSVLKGFQLTCVVGFAWSYILPSDQLDFDRSLTDQLSHNDAARTTVYRERYLDCQGNVDCLSSYLADDIHKIWGSPEPADAFKQGIKNAAVPFMIINQARVALVFGDSRTEKKLKSKLRLA